MPFCQNCGGQLNENDVACPRCRQALPGAPQAAVAAVVPLRSPQRGLLLGSLSDAVLAVQRDPLHLLGLFFLVLAINFLLSFSVSYSSNSGGFGAGLVSHGVSLVAFVFMVGYFLAVQKTLRGATATPHDLLAGFPQIIPIILTNLLCSLLLLLVLVITLVPLVLGLIAWFSLAFLSSIASASSGLDFINQLVPQGLANPNFALYIFLPLLGLFICLIPLFIVSMGFAFWPLRILDGEHRVVESLRQSWEITRGYKLRLFLLFLLFIPLNLAGLLFVVVGLFITIPLSVIAMVAFYERLTRPLP